MNYRHAYHAGNFGDCMKHALLVWLLRALQRKPAPVFVLDTHAGAGGYDLRAAPAERTQEWRGGIGRLLGDPPAALADYVRLIDDPGAYPGSPGLIRGMLCPVDRLACCELHPEDASALRRRFAGDAQVAVHHRDGWEALGALLPPAEKRGLVLIDPPYESKDDFDRLVHGLRRGVRRFGNGVFAAWYPIKHLAPIRALHDAARDCLIPDLVAAELLIREPTDPARLNGCGMLVRNPPFGFAEAAPAILAALLGCLGNGEPGEGWSVRQIAPEAIGR